MLSICANRLYLCWVGSGILLMLAIPWLWWLFVPALLGWLKVYLETESGKQLFLGLLIFATLKYAGGIIWFWQVYPLEWLGLERGLGQLSLIGLYWLVTSLVLGLGFAIVLYGFKFAIKQRLVWLWLLPIVWVIAELFASWLFSVYSLGPMIEPNAKFSFGYLGYLLADSSWLQLSQWGGVYILTAFGVGLVSWCYFLYARLFKKELLLGLIGFSLVLGMAFSVWTFESSQSDLVVKSINTQFDGVGLMTNDGVKRKKLMLLEYVTEALKDDEVDILLLPEDSRFTLAFPDPSFALQFLMANSNRDVVLVDSTTMVDSRGELVLRAFIYDTKVEMVYVVDKQYLVPQGEFMPYLHGWLLEKVMSRDLLERAQGQRFVPGVFSDYDMVSNEVPPVLFCFESVSPTGVKNLLSQQPASVVLHQVSHGWFNHPTILWFNLERMLKVQAVWNQVTIIEAANMKTGKTYLPNGVVLENSRR